MNAHIPDQLDQLSKKELVEVAQIMHETNVDLHSQLAKANERVAELERALSAMNYMVKTLTKGKRSGALEQSEKLVQDFTNKFAIEQQIKGVENAIAHAPSKEKYALPLVDTTDLYDYCEQLRKEQE